VGSGYGAVFLGEAGLGALQLEFGEPSRGKCDGLALLGDPARHLQQYSMDFGLFFFEQTHQFVVLFDGLQWFDENCLSARTRAMNDAIHPALLLRLDGNDKAFTTDRDQLFLHRSTFGKTAHVTVQRSLNQLLLLFNFATDGCKLGRGAVVESPVGQDLVAKEAQELREVLDVVGQLLHTRPRVLHCRRRMQRDLAPFGGAVGDEDDVTQLRGFECGSGYARLFEQRPGIKQSGKFKTTTSAQIIADFLCELLLTSDPVMVFYRREGCEPLAAKRGDAIVAEDLPKAIEFQKIGAGVR